MQIHLVKEFGTVRLLQLTATLGKDDQRTLLEYIGNLEKNQRDFAMMLEQLSRVVVRPEIK